MTEEDMKEAVSLAYVKAICGLAGYNHGSDCKDYGFDITVKHVKIRSRGEGRGRRVESGFNLDIQVKASCNCRIDGDQLVFSLENKNYNDLVDGDIGTKRILVVLWLPKDEDWHVQTPESLMLKKCAYWKYMEGMPAVPDTNSRTVVRIPLNNVFSIEKLTSLMEKIREGGDLNGA